MIDRPTSGTRATRLAAASALGLVLCAPALAFNYVADANGTYWGIQDAAPPRVDTGSIRATQFGFGQQAPYSTSINGFGGIRVQVPRPASGIETAFNGELMRGFGLQFDGIDRFTSTQSVGLGGVQISRAVYVNRGAHWGRWLDTFTNTTRRPMTIQVAFGGQSGIGDAATGGANTSAIVNTASGDTLVSADDAWVTVATPTSGSNLRGAPQVTVLGTPAPFRGAIRFAGNWQHDSFARPLSYAGHDGNFQAYVHTLTLPPGQSRSLLHFVVIGQRVTETTAAAERAAVEAAADSLAKAPPVADLTPAEICSIANYDAAALTAGGFDARVCRDPALAVVAQAPLAELPKPFTRVRYDVVGKSIAQLRADMQAGITTSEQITQAYLDRIAVYDSGPFGFNSVQIVATDALAQARAADAARKEGNTSPLLGIPIVIKNLFDTFDMVTNNGSMTFEGFRPARDAFQVAQLRQAGAVIIGKAAMEEYATSGAYSNDAWGQVWNVFNPSQSALASSGGSASAVAASMAAAALGSQTGDSLYAPASGASLVTLRGTDGLQSGSGIMPLVFLTDFGGAMTRTVSDLADLLNVLAKTDPEDPGTALTDSKVPADWRSVLDANALQGKRIGYIPAVWVDPLGTSNTIDATKAALRFLEEAGATIVEMGETVGGTNTPPVPPDSTTGNLREEGWGLYIDQHPELVTQGFAIRTSIDVNCSQKKVAYVRADPSTCNDPPFPRMTPEEIQAKRDQRVLRQESARAWMDAAGVDAVVYPGLLSDISLNDGGGNRAAFGRRDTPGAANGIPTVVFPAGVNDRGQPINLQLLGRAWDDPMLVGMAYAFELRANAAGSGAQLPTTVPPLRFAPGRAPALPLGSAQR